MSDVQEVKFILNPVLPFHNFLKSLTRLGFCELATMSPLGFESSLAHFDRQLSTVGEPLRKTFFPGFFLKMFISLVIQLLVVFHKVHNSLL